MTLLLENDPELRRLFEQETRQWLWLLKQSLQRLYRFPGDREALSEAQRAAHTLKSNLYMVGLQEPAELASHLNDTLQVALDERLAVSSNDVILWARWVDQISKALLPYGIPYIANLHEETSKGE